MRESWLAAGLLSALAACAGPPERAISDQGSQVVTDSAFADSTAITARLDSALLDTVGPPYRVLALPDSVREFEMATPSGIAIRPAGPCVIAIADGRETTVHYFTTSGRYQGSLFIGGHRRDALSTIGRITMTADGVAYVWELGRRRIAEIDSARSHVRVFHSDLATASMPLLAAIEPVSPNRLIENWMISSLPVRSATWAAEHLPLLRVIDTTGQVVGGLWRIAQRPGPLLTHALNQGYLARQGDTLWFAYAVSGEIIRGVLDRDAKPWTVSTSARFSIPRMYSPQPPRWFPSHASDTVGNADVEQQIQDLAVTDNGTLIVGQTISYPPRNDPTHLHLPSSAVVIYDNTGTFVRGWRVRGRIRQLVAGRGVLAVTVEPTDGSDREVRLYHMTDIAAQSAPASSCVGGR